MGRGALISSPGGSACVGSPPVRTVSYPSWSLLEALRRRGQRPVGAIWVTDRAQQRRYLQESGVFAVEVPPVEWAYWVAGLAVLLTADKCAGLIAVAQALASAHPARLVVLWRGEAPQWVIE